MPRIIPTCVGKRLQFRCKRFQAADHPHVRGEKQSTIGKDSSTTGSSPRAWGKGCQETPDGPHVWIIPTCVGKRLGAVKRRSWSTDHPHVRGEKAEGLPEFKKQTGSSPRAWGKGIGTDAVHLQDRIIPTCVGKRDRYRHGSPVRTDHPHVRGEKSTGMQTENDITGSSPRAWGKELRDVYHVISGRIIPTCVGKSRAIIRQQVRLTDHPHVRGEKKQHGRPMGKSRGSSPRAWGKDSDAVHILEHRRIIPTCVGKSDKLHKRYIHYADHPHVRGEKVLMSWITMHGNGSSPRAWGKARPACNCKRCARIIPTCVGKSWWPWMFFPPSTDHPHVRGEKPHAASNNILASGSSPRAWGKDDC